MSTIGVVIGKFMPLHKGHMYMIEFAKNFVDDLTVLVDNLPSSVDTMTLQDRVDIVQTTFPDIKVKGIDVITYQEPEDAPDFWEAWRDYIIRNVGAKPDYIIGSMDYIKKLAEVLECEYIMVDKDRTHLPISATMIRNSIDAYMNGNHDDFFKVRDFIPDATNLYLTRDIYIVGGESTGKSTLSKKLANQLETICVNEYAIKYIEDHGRDLKENDLINIAKGQFAQQNTFRKKSNLFCIHDTDIITTKIWYKKFFGADEGIFDNLIDRQKDGLYILLKPTIDWVNEDYRYFEDSSDRNWFHEEFKKELAHYGKKFVELSANDQSYDIILSQINSIWKGNFLND